MSSSFQDYRKDYFIPLASSLVAPTLAHSLKETHCPKDIAALFPCLTQQVPCQVNLHPSFEKDRELVRKGVKIGCVLSGGQAAGGHNVIIGLYDYLKHIGNSTLYGFLNGPKGIYEGDYCVIDQAKADAYRNRGGFDMIKSGRNKIETPKQFQDSLTVCETLGLDGLVVIGGDDSNTNACLLAEYFKKMNSNVKVIGCPKTIDGDLKNEFVEVSFGFDTACKTYSELIGNLMIDTLSTKKYYHFIRLMGRSASHITLECALQCRPTYAFIGEEVQAKNLSLQDLVDNLIKIITQRSKNGKDFGIILVPEGLIEFIPEVNKLIQEINQILSQEPKSTEISEIYQEVLHQLTTQSQKLLTFLPKAISEQLLLDRDPHGNVQVAKIETEKLLISLVQKSLPTSQKFSPQAHYFGYEGRCAFPSNFDSNYCYNLGYNAAVLIEKGFTGLMSCIINLKEGVDKWIPCGYPLVAMMNVERRKGKDVPVIRKALTELDGHLFKWYATQRDSWAIEDAWRQIGPIQFEFSQKMDVPFLVNFDSEEFSQQTKNSAYCELFDGNLSELQQAMSQQKVQLSNVLLQKKYKIQLGVKTAHIQERPDIMNQHLPYLMKNSNQLAEIVPRSEMDEQDIKKKLKIGVVYCSRQSPGGNNIIDGLLDYQKINGGEIYGFLHGTKGLFTNKYLKVEEENFAFFRNQGGYHYLGRYADKIRTKEEQEKTKLTCETLDLDGLVLIGASHTFTDAAYLTNYFIENNVKTKIITVPCTIDNNLTNHMLEQSVGFDTASKIYAQLIGNIMIDSASAVKYWYFMRLMGRDPSHLVLECALQTKPNICIISEEVLKKGQSLQDVVNYIADIVSDRAQHQKNYGTLLIPEGFLHYIPLFSLLIQELNDFFKRNQDSAEKLFDIEYMKSQISPWAAAQFSTLPDFTQKQLILERDVHGDINLSQIETERLLAFLVDQELKIRKKAKKFNGSFAPLCHFFGYQGRSGTPSVFDCKLGTSYGFAAAVLIENGITGYSVTARGLTNSHKDWHLGGIPLVNFIHIKEKSSYGYNMPIVPSGDVDLSLNSFKTFEKQKDQWKLQDYYNNSGPTQLFGERKDLFTEKLRLEHQNYQDSLKQVMELTNQIEQSARFGVHEDLLSIIIKSLTNVKDTIQIVEKKFI